NKMGEAAERKDAFSSFMNLASLQAMFDDIAREVAIGEYRVMDSYSPVMLADNAAAYDDALHRYLLEYQKAGIVPKHYSNVEEFAEDYLK
ncbi:MAG: hypothetical protein ACI4AD_09460, partial [Roseburia sp.]